MIKLLDIYKQDKKSLNKILSNINKIIKNNNFINGTEVRNFENNFSKYCNTKYSIGCNSGSDALFLALKSLNLPNNSEVIIPAMTYCATAFAVLRANLKIKLVDIDKERPTISIEDLKKSINKNTKAIIAVHLYGDVCEMKKIKQIIRNKKQKIYLIEDAAQAHGSIHCHTCKNKKKYCCKKGSKAGSLSDLGCFSFYPGKNLGAYGDGGVVTTNNKYLRDKIAKLGNLGGLRKFEHTEIGYNSRLDTIQAEILNIKLTQLDKYNLARKKIANYYHKNISNRHIKLLDYTPGCVFHQYVIISKKIKKIIFQFNKLKIQWGRHYPSPIHKIQSLKKYFKKQSFYNAENLAKYGLSLPIDPNLKLNELKLICKTLNKI